jgi:hypothetical protein
MNKKRSPGMGEEKFNFVAPATKHEDAGADAGAR